MHIFRARNASGPARASLGKSDMCKLTAKQHDDWNHSSKSVLPSEELLPGPPGETEHSCQDSCTVSRNTQFGTSPFGLLKETQKQGPLGELSGLYLSPPPFIHLLSYNRGSSRETKSMTYIPVTSFTKFPDHSRTFKYHMELRSNSDP